jgi:hypothetical protein
MKLLLCRIITLSLVFCIPVLLQAQLPEPTWTDPVGDVTMPAVDYTHGWFVQQGDSLLIGFSMFGKFADRDPVGWSLSSFNVDTDLDPSTGQFCGNEYNLDFHDYGGGNWFGSQYLIWNQETLGFTKRVLLPVKVHEDGKTMTCKVSLVGTGWEEVSYTISDWYKDSNTWHDTGHNGGDQLDEWGFCVIDPEQVTKLEVKEGTNCVVKVPEPYSATADAKNITGALDEMVNWVRSKIGIISDNTKKFRVEYENWANYAHPIVGIEWYGQPNQFGCRIPGSDWVDDPNWHIMLHSVVDQTLMEIARGVREVFLVHQAYNRPIPGYGEGWYCTDDDSTNGFKFMDYHKWTMKALLGIAYENCYSFYIAENLTDGEAKTAIMNKKADMAAAWNSFSGTARDLTPEIMTGMLLSLTDDLSWTETIYKDILPKKLCLGNPYDPFSQLVNNYIRSADYEISSTADLEDQLHHGWYATIASIQAAVINLASGQDVYSAMQGITDFPLDQDVYDTAKDLLGTSPVDPYTADDTVPYVWNEINTVGTALLREEFSAPWATPDTDDGGAGPIPMGISFPFYGQTFDEIYIGVNGQCSFTDHIDWITSGTYGTTIPGMGWDNILCPLACDIMAADAYDFAPYDVATGTMYYYSDPAAGTFTIEYENMTNHHDVVDNVCVDTTLTFQVVLDTSGTITYYYKDLGIAGEAHAPERATVGIQPSKESGLGVQYYGDNTPEGGYPVAGSAIRFQIGGVAVEEEPTARPVSYELFQNYPNPFNPSTNFAFTIAERGKVSLKIYNILGREVATLINGRIMEAGYHDVIWNASGLSAGLYFYRLDAAGQKSFVKKCVLVK